MKKILLTTLLSLSIFSCVSIRFPESIKVDITVPENLDIEKVQVLIDTLRGLNKQGENKIDGVFEFNIQKAETNNEPKGKQQKGMTAPKRD
ncbi:hypothetical protein OAN99_06910 [Flavobacteriaceae bacterium]|jgi:hypothetical protein|nr:hypothetical protein [Flavobacteriaceae bacterium]